MFLVLHSQDALIRGERIARIYVDGVIVQDDARNQTLRHIARDENIRGLIVHIDSPGGTVVGG